MSAIPTTADLTKAISPVLARVARLEPYERIKVSQEINDALLAAQASLAAHRRAAVRQLRSDGWTLREIAEELGMTVQRVHQIEIGMGRKEKARKG